MKIKKPYGFTLIELLIALAIMGLLAAYAIPNYRQYVLRSNRTEAMNDLLQVSHMQERFYANKNRYGSAADLNLSVVFPDPDDNNDRKYTINLESSDTEYTITAQPYGTQAQDTDCPVFSLDSMGNKTPESGCWD